MKKGSLFAVLLVLALLLQAAQPFAFGAKADAASRDTVLVLDFSGSMDGSPERALREAAKEFCRELVSESGKNRVAVVVYANSARVACDFTDDLNVLESAVDVSAGGGTNLSDALGKAEGLIDASAADVKNIMLMTDGLPQSGEYNYSGRYVSADYGDYIYANAAYERAVRLHPKCNLYTLGFFHNLTNDRHMMDFAIRFLNDLQNAGYYEVQSVDDLVFTFGQVAQDIKETYVTGTFRYASGSQKDYGATFWYSDSYFAQSSYIYNPSLATMSMCMALSAFGSNETPANDYTDKSRNVRDLMGQMGFTDFETNSWFTLKPNADSIAAAISHKKITDESGASFTLIAVAVRGGGYEQEWASNFTVGNDPSRHQGFNRAANDVLSLIQTYLNNHADITGEIKLWITGYSRAAATSNLTAATLDKNPAYFGGNVTLSTDGIYAYCMETPMGTTDSDAHSNPVYQNIFNIVNPNDPVPKLAPAAMGFRRYGVDRFLPTQENRYNGYSTVKNAMLDKFYALESIEAYRAQDEETGAQVGGDIYLLDHFVPMQVDLSLLLDFEVPVREADNNRLTLGVFLDGFLNRLVYGFISRDVLVNDLQSGIRELCKALFGDEGKTDAVFERFLGKMKDNWVSLVVKLLWDEYGAYETVGGYLTQSMREEGITGFSDYDIRQAAGPLLDRVLAYLANNLDDLATFVENRSYFFTAHYPELCLAWLMSQDPRYNPVQDRTFVSGSYRIIHINCPVDVTVTDSAGRTVAIIAGEEVTSAEELAVSALINENGEKILYLPPDEEFTVSVSATDAGQVSVSVDEFNPAVGGVVRRVSYFDQTVSAGDRLVLSAPRLPDSLLTVTAETGSAVPYALSDPYGNLVAPDVDEASSAGSQMGLVTLTSSDPKNGAVTGGGAYTLGSYAIVHAIPAEKCEFDGWYDGNTKVSDEKDYRFCVKQDVSLTARFSKDLSGIWLAVGISAGVLALLGLVLWLVFGHKKPEKENVFSGIQPGYKGAVKVLGGENDGLVAPVPEGQRIIIGRDPAVANVVLSQRYTHLSRAHCSLRYDGASRRYFLTDLSSNGVFMDDGRRLPANTEVKLVSGSTLKLGDDSCRILLV